MPIVKIGEEEFDLSEETIEANRLYDFYFSKNGKWNNEINSTIYSLLEKSPPEKLWHYCSLESFGRIIDSKKMFMSNINSLNDYKEGRWIEDLLILKIESDHKDLLEFLSFIKTSTKYYLLGPYILSLSSENDILSQWRSYANGGKGVGIGLDTGRAAVPTFSYDDEILANQTFVTNVIYDKSIQDVVVDNIIQIMLSITSEIKAEEAKIGRSFDKHDHPLESCASRIVIYLHHLSPLFKNPAFSEEKEWRIIHYPAAVIGNTDSVDLLSREIYPLIDKLDINFRFSESNMIDFFRFPGEGSVIEFLKGFIIGPACMISENDLIIFLKRKEIREFTVEKSKATLRVKS